MAALDPNIRGGDRADPRQYVKIKSIAVLTAKRAPQLPELKFAVLGLSDSLRQEVEESGVGVTVLLEKIAGAAAERGQTLAQVKAIAEKVTAAAAKHGAVLRG